MGFQAIDTGYKPEFGLGALYQGFNAANADQSSQEDILRQFLANQREQQAIPLDMQQKQLHNQGTVFDNMTKELQGNQSQAQNNAPMLANFAQAKDAGNQEAIRKNDIGALLQPFIKQQVPIEQGTKTQQLDLAKQLSDIDRVLAGGPDPFGKVADPAQLPLWEKERANIVARMGNTPEQSGKTALEQVKGDNRLAETDLAGQWALRAAEARAKAAANGGSNTPLKMIQSDVNNLEKQLTTSTTQLNNAEFTNNVMKMDPTGTTLQQLRSHQAQLQSQLSAKRAELQAALGQPKAEAPQATDTPPQKMTLSKLQSMYPGLSAEKLKEAYKMKFGEDIE